MPDERLDFAYSTVGQVASQLVVNENGTTPVLYMVRLKIVTGQITEIQSMAVRQAGAANGFFQPANLKPQPVFTQAIDPSMRMTRDQLTTLMNHDPDYLDGKKTGAMVPFDTNCARYENGVATASGVASFDAVQLGVDRRAPDPDHHSMKRLIKYRLAHVPVRDDLPPRSSSGEAFKMIGGKIMMIQAVMADMPADAWN